MHAGAHSKCTYLIAMTLFIVSYAKRNIQFLVKAIVPRLKMANSETRYVDYIINRV